MVNVSFLSPICSATIVLPKSYICLSGEIIPFDAICDGADHCVNGDDEWLPCMFDSKYTFDRFPSANHETFINIHSAPIEIIHCYDKHLCYADWIEGNVLTLHPLDAMLSLS